MEDLIKRILKIGGEKKVSLSELKDFLNSKNKKIAEEILKKKDIDIYSVRFIEEGEISYGITFINPGKIGSEYFMTKGHYHTHKSSEIYYLISGKGKLVIKKGKDRRIISMKKGVFHYIPYGYGHRTINVGKNKLVFLSIYQSDAGHDYEKVKREGL